MELVTSLGRLDLSLLLLAPAQLLNSRIGMQVTYLPVVANLHGQLVSVVMY